MGSDGTGLIPVKNDFSKDDGKFNSTLIGSEKFNNDKSNNNDILDVENMDLDSGVSVLENASGEEDFTFASKIDANETNTETIAEVVESEPQYKTYTVSRYGSGEGFSTLWDISKNSGFTIEEIKAFNPEIGEDNIIHPGQLIRVPIEIETIEESVVEEIPEAVVKEVSDTIVETPVEEKIVEANQETVVETPVEESLEDTISSNTNVLSSVSVPQDVRQTGIIPNYTNYEYFYGKWNSGTKQCKLSEMWAANGKTSDRGIATIDDNYLVAVSPVFGEVGDKIGVVLEDGTTIDCIIADVKGGDADSKYGHKFGSQVDVIEWESLGKQDTIELGDWKGKDVAEIVNYGNILKG